MARKKKYQRPEEIPFTGLAAAPDTEFSTTFAQGMADRMAVSFFKYGLVAEAYPKKVNAIESLKTRLDLYLNGGEVKGVKIEAGNTEYLMDVANFAMIEFMHPKHPKAFFKSTDSNGSPGRNWNDGEVTDAPHGEQQQADAVNRFYANRGSE
jgi:hypothetical protein